MDTKNATTNRDFIYTIPSKIMHDNDLSLNDIKIYMIVRSFMDTAGSCYASNNWIASNLRIHRTTVIECIKNLIQKTYLVRTEVNGQRYLSVNYTPCPMEVVVSTLPPSSLQTTPPSSVETTQYNSNIINTKNIKSIVDSDESPIEKTSSLKVKDYEKDERFMQFYSIYPKKQKPRDAWKAFKALKTSDAQLNLILEDVKARIERHTQWQEAQFIPFPASYLRSGEFEGEIFNQAEQMEVKKKYGLEESKKRQEEQDLFTRKQEEYERTKKENYNRDGAAFRAIVDTVNQNQISKIGSEELRKLKQQIGCRR